MISQFCLIQAFECLFILISLLVRWYFRLRVVGKSIFSIWVSSFVQIMIEKAQTMLMRELVCTRLCFELCQECLYFLYVCSASACFSFIFFWTLLVTSFHRAFIKEDNYINQQIHYKSTVHQPSPSHSCLTHHAPLRVGTGFWNQVRHEEKWRCTASQ